MVTNTCVLIVKRMMIAMTEVMQAVKPQWHLQLLLNYHCWGWQHTSDRFIIHFAPVTSNQHPEIFFLLFFSPVFSWLISFHPVSLFSLSHIVVHNLCHSFSVQMEKTVVAISIWQKLWEHIIIWHYFLTAVALICWEACPDCPLPILMEPCVNILAAACTATLRTIYRLSFVSFVRSV